MFLTEAFKCRCLAPSFFISFLDQLDSEFAKGFYLFLRLCYFNEKWKIWCGTPLNALEEVTHVLIAFSRKTMN